MLYRQRENGRYWEALAPGEPSAPGDFSRPVHHPRMDDELEPVTEYTMTGDGSPPGPGRPGLLTICFYVGCFVLGYLAARYF